MWRARPRLLSPRTCRLLSLVMKSSKAPRSEGCPFAGRPMGGGVPARRRRTTDRLTGAAYSMHFAKVGGPGYRVPAKASRRGRRSRGGGVIVFSCPIYKRCPLFCGVGSRLVPFTATSTNPHAFSTSHEYRTKLPQLPKIAQNQACGATLVNGYFRPKAPRKRSIYGNK